ncbi:CBS domain-containing protein [Flavilitoribacter nigricans]|uniref:CBS domain-containing protein n=1 Tax=Flavilitoribacter nigricans (strain ATCC 23147 / DSM 23189 / NBRC 102662 / NCIMB 1420 / SS-2) TaxID=1122177 RepID=A0A2D0MZZ8_FLAN2|nr:CBS domain-containing protein [Flavilitoribacter nigricans]PHN01696.1 CBS domain-containing protein [Flavilitoribacter nigricans DSM 23189 = NBRC 102662]
MIKYLEIRDLMTYPVVTVHPSDKMEKAAVIFDNEPFHHIPVVDDERKVVGMISRHDYNKILNAFTVFNTENSRRSNETILKALLTRDVMTKQLATINANDPIEKAVGMFQENRFHALPVVNDDKQLEGIITTYDLLNYAFNERL